MATNTLSLPWYILNLSEPQTLCLRLVRQNARDCFANYSFDQRALGVMHNWEDLHECADERDAERIRRQANRVKESCLLTKSVA